MVNLSALFFLFGFITCLNDILVPHLKALFALSYQQSMLIQFAFFSAYFLFSLPSGTITKRFGYPTGVVSGLLLAGVGALMFLPAGYLLSYPLFLTALFVLACGITLIQVAANPYVSILGPSHLAPARLTLVGAFNSLGTTLAPLVGAGLILTVRSDGASPTDVPYLVLGSLLLIMAIVIKRLRLPEIRSEEPIQGGENLWKVSHFRFGVLAIFFYVGAEVSIGSFLVNHIEASWDMSAAHAGHYVSAYWFLAMVGRFMSTWFLRRFKVRDCLFVASAGAVLLVLFAIAAPASLSPWCLIVCGLCNSLMFPVIFTLSIDKLGAQTEKGSSYLCMAIVGGAILPLLQGGVADNFGLKTAFAVPALAYMYLAYFALRERDSRALACDVPSV